ncbi:MAG: hypothetical protein P3T54_08390 [Dehalogenimonas sp.]|uniref:COMM domain-containing protein n=1 Tax=Candidatus Dehalogenimonas loeffleri TaxID=3127115 RepID=A0ABZ2J6E0_9CHLR|nr:hypothetical protein [Dehalogenimonas sp.]
MAENKLIFKNLTKSSGFQRDFKELVSLSKHEIDEVIDTILKQPAFDVSDELVENVAEKLKLSIEKSRSAFNVAEYLRSRAFVTGLSADIAFREVCDFADSLSLKCDARLKTLFSPDEKQEKTLMAKIVATSILPFFSNMQVRCDLRAVERHDKSIIGYVPIGLVEMTISKESGENDVVSFQLDEKDVDESISNLEELKALFQTVKNDLGHKIIPI